MYDCLIIGGGPAGVTAALYTARAGFKTLVLYKDHGALEKAESVDNFYGTLAVPGKRLINRGLRQAKLAGVEVIKREVVSLSVDENLVISVDAVRAKYMARAVLVATGAGRLAPNIPGLKELEGRGISYCAVCDGFFHKGKDVAVIGIGAYALHEVQDLIGIAASVTVLTNGAEAKVKFPKGVRVVTEKITEVTSKDGLLGKSLKGVTLGNGEELELSGLFIALNVAGGTDLARKLGAPIEGNFIKTGENGRTNIPNLWAAGDCTGGIKQIAKAACDGMHAGMDIIKYLRGESK